jgi:hypothetical protein
MIICIKYGGQLHCFTIPLIEIPIRIPLPGPGPVNYPQLFSDAMVLGTIRSMTQHLADGKVREAVQSGFTSALKAMQAHAGSEVTVRAE